MSRISLETRAKYPLKIRDGQTEDDCYFCGQGAAMDDFTPAISAAPLDMERMTEPFVRVRACMKCWKRIYTVNVVERATRFNVPKGCMSLRQKEAMFGNTEAMKALSDVVNRYSISFVPPIVAPLGLSKLESGRFLWNGHSLHNDEIIALQGGLALRMLNLSRYSIEVALMHGLASGDLDGDHMDIYREMLGLPSQQEMIDEEVNRADSH